MKNLIKTVMVAGLVSIASAACADEIRIEGYTVLDGLGWKVPIKGVQGWTPSKPRETIKVGGKTCDFGTSVQGSVPDGCNYVIEITPEGIGFNLNKGRYSSTCTKNGPPVCY